MDRTKLETVSPFAGPRSRRAVRARPRSAAGLFVGALGLWIAGGAGAAFAQSGPEATYNAGRFPASLAADEQDRDLTGLLETYSPAGGVANLAANPFFKPLGTNGRSCATCHQPPSAMSISLSNIQARYTATGGLDPVFDMIDGANCPNLATQRGQPASAFSLLLNQGVFRIALQMPANAEFKVEVLQDPYGCNTNPAYNQGVDQKTGKTVQIVSVYRRPLPASNLPFVTVSDLVHGHSAPAPFAIMWDGREQSLAGQALDAVNTHMQPATQPTVDQINNIVAFESGLFAAQIADSATGKLTLGGATGGAVALSAITPGQSPNSNVTMPQFSAWSTALPATARASIYRGEVIFNTRKFGLFNVPGINQPPNTPTPWTCSRCHSQAGSGNDPNGTLGLLGIGIGGSQQSFGGPAPTSTLPLFRVTCNGTLKTPYLGQQITTNDPGAALITGLCKDLEKFKTTTIRGMAARAPYFHDGTAATMTDVVNVYNARFNIGLSSQDVQDLVNFLNAL